LRIANEEKYICHSERRKWKGMKLIFSLMSFHARSMRMAQLSFQYHTSTAFHNRHLKYHIFQFVLWRQRTLQRLQTFFVKITEPQASGIAENFRGLPTQSSRACWIRVDLHKQNGETTFLSSNVENLASMMCNTALYQIFSVVSRKNDQPIMTRAYLGHRHR